MGGVFVTNLPDAPLNVPLPLGATLRDAIEALGARALDTDDEAPSVFIGGPPRERGPGFRVRAVFDGWRGGVVPAHAEFAAAEEYVMPLAPMLAAAIAVSEAFFFVRGRTPIAGRRKVGLSLWRPASRDWLSSRRRGAGVEVSPIQLVAHRFRSSRAGLFMGAELAALSETDGSGACPSGRR